MRPPPHTTRYTLWTPEARASCKCAPQEHSPPVRALSPGSLEWQPSHTVQLYKATEL